MSVRIRSASAKKPGRKKTSKAKKQEAEKKKKQEAKEQEELRKQRQEAFSASPATKAFVKTKETILEKFSKAASEKKLVEFLYKDAKGKKSRRRIEPYSLKYDPAGLKISGYCFLRKATRIFFLKNVSDVFILAETFEPRYEITMLADVEALKNKKL